MERGVKQKEQKQLQKLRKEYRLTRKQLAMASGINEKRIVYFENISSHSMAKMLSYHEMLVLSKVFDVSPEALLNDDERKRLNADIDAATNLSVFSQK